MARLSNSIVTSYALSVDREFKVHHIKSSYNAPVVHSKVGPAYFSIRMRAVTRGVLTYQHHVMFDRFISKFKVLKKKVYLQARVYLNATKKPTEVRMGKGKGKFEHKIAPVSPGTDFLEIRLGRLESMSVEQWADLKAIFFKDAYPVLDKLSKKLPFRSVISFNDL